MHPFDIIILISIACCVGFVAAIHVRKDPVLATGYFVASASGSLAGGYFADLADFLDKPGILMGGFGGAIALTVLWHRVRLAYRSAPPPDDAGGADRS